MIRSSLPPGIAPVPRQTRNRATAREDMARKVLRASHWSGKRCATPCISPVTGMLRARRPMTRRKRRAPAALTKGRASGMEMRAQSWLGGARHGEALARSESGDGQAGRVNKRTRARPGIDARSSREMSGRCQDAPRRRLPDCCRGREAPDVVG